MDSPQRGVTADGRWVDDDLVPGMGELKRTSGEPEEPTRVVQAQQEDVPMEQVQA